MSSVVETDVVEVQEGDTGYPQQVNDYHLLELIGEGAFAKVFKCEKRSPDGNETFAMKVINKSFLKRKKEFKRVNGRMVVSNAFQKVQKEVAIMKKLSHQNLTKLYEVIDSPEQDKLYLVLEYIGGGQAMYWEPEENMYKHVKTNGPAPEDFVQTCMADLALGIEYIHANNICHRDIKPENVLLTSNGLTFKLGDFGVAHMFNGEEEMNLKNTEGTYHFLAPECLSGGSYDPFKVDIWAIGVTLFAMRFGRVPFASGCIGLGEVMDAIKSEELEFPTKVSEDFESLIRGLLTRDPDERLTIDKIKAHPWVNVTQRARGASYPPIEQVLVSDADIDLAFTPVNNFMMMSMLKVRMAGKLAKARRNIDSRGKSDEMEIVTEEEQQTTVATNGNTNDNVGNTIGDKINVDSEGDRKRLRNQSTDDTALEKKNRHCIIS